MNTKTTGYNRSAQINGFNLSYDDVGKGEIPIIFMHGFPFDKTSWELQLEFLKFCYRLIAFDIRGFGQSPDDHTPLSMDLWSEDLIAFMDHKGIDKAIICGLSMGGYIALRAQKRFPERFEAIILCDTQCEADTEEVRENRFKTIEKIKADGVSDFYESFLKKAFSKSSLSNKTEVVEQLRTVLYANSQHALISGLVALAEREESCSTLENIKIPTLIICGKEDEITPVAKSEYMHSAIKGSILKVIENAGHVSNLEQPHKFAQHLSDFLDILPGVGAEFLDERWLDS
jgi:3-oxoadipate enol-lactonase